VSYKDLFSRFLEANPERLHMAAHSHHLWPDVTYDAQRHAWTTAAELVDRKWGHIFSEVMPTARAHIARLLGLPTGDSIAFAPNTHELLKRIVSCLPTPARILTTDSEFHSFSRQCQRWEEAGRVSVVRIPVEPFATFAERFVDAARSPYDLVFVSHVFFNSGFVFDGLAQLCEAMPDDGFAVIDAYHGFMALPTDLGPIADRAFYLAGGYKYAMAGEGVCFVHSPPGYGPRPVDTGWYAAMGELESGSAGVGYPTGGSRFLGSTFDPSGLFRFNAVQDMLVDRGITVATIHQHVEDLQRRFLDRFDSGDLELIPAIDHQRGHFLTYRTERAGELAAALAAANVVVDYRADRLRLGFGLYHDTGDVDRLVAELTRASAP
jgi:selenocysteine lyase/cysteine desulfurase